jgi:Holliday junction resolvasome RuvABC DNA-binding subunit
VAQMILSLWVARLKSAIANDDKKTLESVKWVWKKMAEKIILEFHDKDWVLTSSDNTSWSISKNISSNIPSDLESQILSTLTLMWYNLQKVQEILKEVPEELSTLEQILPYVIKKM